VDDVSDAAAQPKPSFDRRFSGMRTTTAKNANKNHKSIDSKYRKRPLAW